MIETIGLIAAFLTTISFLPQALKTFKTKDVSAISLPMFVCQDIGVACWIFYAIKMHSMPLLLANMVILPLVLIITYLKIKFNQPYQNQTA